MCRTSQSNSGNFMLHHSFVNPWRACARVTVVVLCVCLCVYLSVPALAASASVETSNNDTHGFHLGFSWKMRGFSKICVQKPICKYKLELTTCLHLRILPRVLHFSGIHLHIITTLLYTTHCRFSTTCLVPMETCVRWRSSSRRHTESLFLVEYWSSTQASVTKLPRHGTVA